MDTSLIHAKVLICTSHNITLLFALLATLARGISRPSLYLKGFVASATFALMRYAWAWQVMGCKWRQKPWGQSEDGTFMLFQHFLRVCLVRRVPVLINYARRQFWDLELCCFTFSSVYTHWLHTACSWGAKAWLSLSRCLLWGKQTLGFWSTVS